MIVFVVVVPCLFLLVGGVCGWSVLFVGVDVVVCSLMVVCDSWLLIACSSLVDGYSLIVVCWCALAIDLVIAYRCWLFVVAFFVCCCG